MHITIACGSMSFGPETPSRASLGGSETAALMFAKALAARGHDVTMFCNLPEAGKPDFFPSGEKHSDGVRYVSLSVYGQFITIHETDLLIAVRDPSLIAIPAQAKKKVLWMHDIATTRSMKRAFEQMMFTFDEVWTVTEWHKHQVSEVTGYPLERIVALRNGIVKYDDILTLPRNEKQIVYASRPERGLENLVRPGGVMEHLPDFKLVVAMYEHFPEHMKDFYNYIYANMKRLPNVEFIGGKPNHDLRQIIAESAAYIYPTQFEETSCILARECIEQGTPFLTTSVGSLPETLGDCGIYFEDWLFHNGIVEPTRGGDGWCKLFAMFFREILSNPEGISWIREKMANRDDLYWDGVAAMAEPHFAPQPVTAFSRLYSLIQDGDVIPAMAYYASVTDDTHAIGMIAAELQIYRKMLDGDLAKYYDETYRNKGDGPESELVFHTKPDGQRAEAIADQIATLPPGSTIFEYGCGPGHVLAPLAVRFPQYNFVGYDFSPAAIATVNNGASVHGITNLQAFSQRDTIVGGQFDAVICSEVLEHVTEPWNTLVEVEDYCVPGGLIVITTPFGAWEPETYERKGKWKERNHLWSIDRQMMLEMIGSRQDFKTTLIVAGCSQWMRGIGNNMFTWRAEPSRAILPVDPLAKALRHNSRETCAAAIICWNNEDTIVKLLDSLEKKVQYVKIALGPCTDDTPRIIEKWFDDRPWMIYETQEVPKIEPRKFGFDDARNASVKDLEKDCEWIFWIDTDEYLSGDFRKYLRPSSCDGYLVAQHHFTVEPRGKAAEIDRPARLIRTDRGYRCEGHIHEHFEVPGGGPGRTMLLADVDIGHPGYVNENVRRGRFFRNFPFLEWEHEEGGDRKLHKFLWFRDLVHRFRFAQEPVEKKKLAQEGIEWYKTHQSEMGNFGPGIFMALQYLSELYTFLGKGVQLRLGIQLDDRSTTLEGRFESYEQIEAILGQMLREEFKERTSHYYG